MITVPYILPQTVINFSKGHLSMPNIIDGVVSMIFLLEAQMILTVLFGCLYYAASLK